MTDTLEKLFDLFDGNKGAVGTEEGGALRLGDVGVSWFDAVEDHWTGVGPPVGVYPTRSFPRHDGDVDQLCHWGCIDYDTPGGASADKSDSDGTLINAWNTQRLLARFGISSWIEVSRSKGHHLWVFARQWTPVPLMRTALLASQQLLGIPPKEVNPKQMALADGQLGNYVRLPYPGALGPPTGAHGRKVVEPFPDHLGRLGGGLVEGTPLTVHEFAERAHADRVPATALEALAARYEPPPPPAQLGGMGTLNRDAIDAALDRTIPYLNGYAYVIWRDGPTEGSDRSGTLARLAHRVAGNVPMVPPADCLALLADLDSRPFMRKFTDREDGQQQLERMVARAYGGVVTNPTGDMNAVPE